jgi:hypothetical protein
MDLTLFDDQAPIGILKGFSPLLHQLEADVVMPASARLHPRFGEFLLLETDSASALVGRVSRFQAAVHRDPPSSTSVTSNSKPALRSYPLVTSPSVAIGKRTSRSGSASTG